MVNLSENVGSQMKIRSKTFIFYAIALGYIFVGALFYDWSTRMVPTKMNISNKVLLAVDLQYIFIGILLYFATFLTSRGKVKRGFLFFRFVFWGGVSVLVGHAGYVIVGVNSERLSILKLGDIVQQL